MPFGKIISATICTTSLWILVVIITDSRFQVVFVEILMSFVFVFIQEQGEEVKEC